MNDIDLNEDIHQYPIVSNTDSYIETPILQVLDNKYINSYFDKIYCINLARRYDRWNSVEKRLREQNINATRFDAIDGESLIEQNGLTRNELGCLSSHLKIIQDAKIQGYNKILIFEDDVYFSNDFQSKIQLIQDLDWKLLYLGGSQYSWNDIDTSKYSYHSKKTLGTFAYAIDKSIYDDLIQEFSKKDAPVDWILVRIQEKYYGQCFTIYPNIVIADVRKSDIRDERDMTSQANKMRWDLENFYIDGMSPKKNKFYLNYYFDEVYCINLDRRGDRWEIVKKQFDKHGIRVTRVSAVDAKDITYDKFYPYFYDKPFVDGKHVYQEGDIENKAALGCLKTHLNIIKDAKLKGHTRVLIFEDDVVLSNEFDSEIRKIENLDWKMVYLGATQYDWSNLFIGDGLYLSKNTYGTFAYAVDSSIYDYLIDKIENSRQTIDRTYISAQKDLTGHCYTIYPNIVVPYTDESDIRDAVDINKHAETMRWKLDNFVLEKYRKKKILLMPDARGWAFDNIVKAIVKYNPCPDKIHYEIMYARDLHQHKCTVDLTEWDLIYVMFEAERIIPQAKNVIRGCYAAYWLENKNYPPKILGKYFARCKGAVFANKGLKDQLVPYLPSNFPTEIIPDAADETVFYPIEGKKNSDFTVLFVGNTKRKIKNFSNIVWVCQEAGVTLKVCEKVEHKELVYEYATADLCINFSTFEGGPQTFVEAALCGVPMLIRNTNELSKIIPCFIGETTEDFVSIINHLKNNRDECAKKGRDAYEVAINGLTYRHAADKFAKFFLKNVPKKNLETELTVFIIRSGKNPNYEDCLESIKNQNCTFVLDEIVDVSPMSAAFQQMIERCDTPYYVQVDEDMILEETTIERLYYSIKCTKRNICMVTHMLTDVHLNTDIFGIKIYRHDIMINYPYNLDIISCEKDQMTRLENDGYIVQMIEKSLGKHSPKWTTELIYERYFDLMEKWKIYKYDWISNLPKKLLSIVKENPTDENIYALIGAMMSISNKEPIRKREKNFLIKEDAYQNIKEMLEKKD